MTYLDKQGIAARQPVWPERHIFALSVCLTALMVVGFVGWTYYLRSVAVDPPVTGTVDVVSASFGQNCGAPKDNVVQWVRSACSGLKRCDFRFNGLLLGNPAPSCTKEFRVEWRCSRDGAIRSNATSEPPQGMVVPLVCE